MMAWRHVFRFAPYAILEDNYPAGQGVELALAYANRSAVLGNLKYLKKMLLLQSSWWKTDF